MVQQQARAAHPLDAMVRRREAKRRTREGEEGMYHQESGTKSGTGKESGGELLESWLLEKDCRGTGFMAESE